MLFARVPAHDGNPEALVAADNERFQKADFYDLSAQGLLLCSGKGHDGLPCTAQVTHVKGGFADGGVVERSSHFRVLEPLAHSKGCDNIDDPRSSKRRASIREALENEHPILVNINIASMGVKNGNKILGPEFNASVDNPSASLWKKAAWLSHVEKTHGIHRDDIVTAPARDITDVLYYLELAKEWGLAKGGHEAAQKAMEQLWFNTGHMVQPCKRFVVSDNPAKIGQLVRQFIRRTGETLDSSGELFDTPRLFRFEISNKQVKKAIEKSATHLIYAEQVEIDVAPEDKPEVLHLAQLAMRMKNESGLDNQRVLKVGRTLWVIAVPTLGRFKAYQVKHKGLGKPIPQSKARSRFSHAARGPKKPVTAANMSPAHIFLQIGCPEQMVAVDAPRKKPAMTYKVPDNTPRGAAPV